MNNYDQWKLETPWDNEQDSDIPFEYTREDLENAFEALYDHEYIDLDKFYNANTELLNAFEANDDLVIEELAESLQSFLDFETNYNLSIDDMLI